MNTLQIDMLNKSYLKNYIHSPSSSSPSPPPPLPPPLPPPPSPPLRPPPTPFSPILISFLLVYVKLKIMKSVLSFYSS